MDDVVLGDNGEIFCEMNSSNSTFLWINGMVWKKYASPFDTEVIRNVQRYDDIDFVQGNDEIHGNSGNDILHGQRGNDEIHGGSGKDIYWSGISGNTSVAANTRRITTGCDEITTDANGTVFATGDSLTLMWRTQLGGVFGDLALAKAKAIQERLQDIELVLVTMHLTFSELHTDILMRAQADLSSGALSNITDGQKSTHYLNLADDTIIARGDWDIIIGDSCALYFQVDRSGAGFFFEALTKSDSQNLHTDLKAIDTIRDDQLDAFIETCYDANSTLTNTELASLPYHDVPFLWSIGNDNIEVGDAAILVAGDFALIGLVKSDQDVSDKQITSKSPYTASIEALRFPPSVESFQNKQETYNIAVYSGRYDSSIAKR